MAQIRNGIIGTPAITETGSEPLTTAQAKDWLKMPYTTDDTLISTLIKTARKFAESYCSISVIGKTIVVVFTHDGEKAVRLPRGPVATVTGVRYRSCRLKDWTTITTETTTWEVEGDEFIGNCVGYYEVTYTAGYGAGLAPEGIVTAMKQIIARLYEKRGDEKGFELNPTEMNLLNEHALRFWA
jgi:uncharacterized phiE125 gp8 family phage protein